MGRQITSKHRDSEATQVISTVYLNTSLVKPVKLRLSIVVMPFLMRCVRQKIVHVIWQALLMLK